jgi:hypothetical protein
MALKGNLQDFGTTQLLNLVHLARKTGALQFSKDNNEPSQRDTSELFFRQGKLIHALMSGYDGMLTSMLEKSGKLPPEQADVIRRRSKDMDDKRLAMILIQNGYVSREDVVQSATRYIQEIVYRLFTWREGEFLFDPDKQPHNSRITVPIDLANIIMEGSRRVQESERLEDELPNLNMSLKFTDHPDAKLRNISLSEQEWKVISYVKPENSIRRIARATKMSDLQIRRIVYGLLQAGIVDLVGQPQSHQPAMTRQSARSRSRPGRQERTSSSAEPSAAPGPTATVGTRTYVKRGIVNRLIDRIKRL